jgi:outer membrane protein OmpA-like peptidoglycan-associated protein
VASESNLPARVFRPRLSLVLVAGLLASALVFPRLAGATATALKIQVDKSRVDLVNRKLELRMNHPAGHVQLKVYGTSGDSPLIETDQSFGGHPPNDLLTVSWPPPEAEVGRIEIRAYDADGFFVGVAIVPWSVLIPHEEVNFATDSAVITPGEATKLEASHKLIAAAIAKHRELGSIKLFIAGHTDTVGANAYNLKLSARRAQAIASWFRKQCLRLPIFYEGFGEQALLVATPDSTDEARNRRVDYILGVDEPTLKATAFRPAWKPLQ